MLRPAVSCCVSAAGVRFLGTLSCQTGFRPHCCRPTAHTAHTRAYAADPGRVTRSTRVRPGPGRALSVPRGRRCSLAIPESVAAACRLTTAGPYHPSTASQPGVFASRGISESFLVVAPYRSFPLPVTAMVGTAVLELSRELRTRPIRNRPRASRWGQVEHKPEATSSTYVEPPSTSSLTTVRSDRGALLVLPPVGFPGPPPEPGVPITEHRALHKPR